MVNSTPALFCGSESEPSGAECDSHHRPFGAAPSTGLLRFAMSH